MKLLKVGGVVKSPIYCVVAHFEVSLQSLISQSSLSCSFGILFVWPYSQTTRNSSESKLTCISKFLLSHPEIAMPLLGAFHESINLDSQNKRVQTSRFVPFYLLKKLFIT